MAESDGRLRSEKGHAASLSEVTPVDVASTGATAGANSSKADAGEPGKRGFTPDEVFSTLDSAPNGVRPEWRHASGTRAEAGFNDPALGWVGVRANSEGGGVHASLVPDSAGAAETLGGQMAGLSAYLAEQHAPVDSLTLAAPEHHTNPYGPDQNAGQGMQQGTGQQTGQGNDPETPSDSQQSLPASRTTPSPMEAAPNGGLGRNAEATRPGGQHVSVMA